MPQQYTPHDQGLVGAVTLSLPYTTPIEFQFPPRIPSDSRRGNWKDDKWELGQEPIANYMGSGPRTLALTWTYIVDGADWTTDKIHTQCKNLRAYFQKSLEEAANANYLVGMIQIWNVGGNAPFSCRVSQVDIKHGDTIVGQGAKAFPLRTDVTIDVKLWAQGGQHEQIQQIDDLKPLLTQDWY